MKKIIAFFLTLCLLLTLAACGAKPVEEPAEQPAETAAEAPADEVTIRLGGLKGPTTMGMVKLLDDSDKGLTANKYTYQMAAAADELTPLLLKGELDVLAVPVNLASILYKNSEHDVQLLAINTLGVLYVIEKGGETVTDWESLRGKTIYSSGKGSTPEYAFRYLLAQNGLDMDTDVTMEWKSEPSEIVSDLAAQEQGIAVLPQPFVTVASTKLEGLRVAMDLTAEWDKLNNGSKLLTAGLVVRKAFAEEHPVAVTKLLEEYALSVKYVNDNPAEASTLIEAFDIVKAPIAEKAIPFCNLVCITGAEMQTATEGYLQTLFDQNPKAVGGELPGADFYYAGQ